MSKKRRLTKKEAGTTEENIQKIVDLIDSYKKGKTNNKEEKFCKAKPSADPVDFNEMKKSAGVVSGKNAELLINKIFSENAKKKEPTGILKDLSELKRYELFKGTVETKFKDLTKEGEYVRWSDVEAIINKYMNP